MDGTTSTTLPEFKISVTRAFKAIFQSENWAINVMWLTIASLLSSVFVGQIALFGWASELLSARSGRPENGTPDVDSDRLGDYLSKGVWPFVIYFLLQIAASIVMLIPLAIVAIGLAAIVAAIGDESAGVLFPIILVPMTLVLSILIGVATVGFLIRALVCQNFERSLDLKWVREFVRLMFWDIVISSIKFWLLSVCVGIVGTLLLCVGYLPAMGIIFGAAMHLVAQWYELYLSRGGVPAPPANGDEVIDAAIV